MKIENSDFIFEFEMKSSIFNNFVTFNLAFFLSIK